MEMRFPVLRSRHAQDGILLRRHPARPETEPRSRSRCRPERRINETRLEVRYSPTLAGAMVDALPYLVDYPYGCTEQTLNRFLPTVITQKTLKHEPGSQGRSRSKRRTSTLRRSATLGSAAKRLEAASPTQSGLRRGGGRGHGRGRHSSACQTCSCSDGGWGWFSGCGERSWPHTTALVVHGLQIAQAERRRICRPACWNAASSG